MGDVAIRAENLSKLYRIGEHRGGYDTLREKIVHTFSSSFRYLCRNTQSKIRNPQSETIWALKDISFEVRHGEVVGIIGRNGAGKTTLLKILSRITEPTEGWTEIRGRVGSLLEVGTGFHPELTGRENIYLNGAILGMKKVEIDREFDKIVAFSEVEKFIDTPVKRYSSGMRVRLAFAVAAHLEPEILLVDEVLAVGDAVFQKKCLGKMGDVAKEGRTVLFVSHNMGAITAMCPRTILLEGGNIELDGSSNHVVESYLKSYEAVHTEGEVTFQGSGSDAFFTRAAVVNESKHVVSTINVQNLYWILLEYVLKRSIADLEVSFAVFNRSGSKVFACVKSADTQDRILPNKQGQYQSLIKIPSYFLAPGFYRLSIALHQPNIRSFDTHQHVLTFQIVETGSHLYKFAGTDLGNILVSFPWRTTRQEMTNVLD